MAKATDEYVTALQRALDAAPPAGVVSAYVFGSRAHGRAHRESDLDVGVLLAHAAHPTRRDRFEAQLRLHAALGGLPGGVTLDLVVLNDAPPVLARHIVTTGRRIFCADAASDHAFLRDAQLRAADLVPFLRRMRRLELAALTR